jgi:hypothetical protein
MLFPYGFYLFIFQTDRSTSDPVPAGSRGAAGVSVAPIRSRVRFSLTVAPPLAGSREGAI